MVRCVSKPPFTATAMLPGAAMATLLAYKAQEGRLALRKQPDLRENAC